MARNEGKGGTVKNCLPERDLGPKGRPNPSSSPHITTGNYTLWEEGNMREGRSDTDDRA